MAYQRTSICYTCRCAEWVEWGFISNLHSVVLHPFRLDFQCEGVESEMNHLFPAFSAEHAECGLQQDPLLFSCAGSSPKYQRLCPCRDFVHGQVALCRDCLWPEGEPCTETLLSLKMKVCGETLMKWVCSLPLTTDWLPKKVKSLPLRELHDCI